MLNILLDSYSSWALGRIINNVIITLGLFYAEDGSSILLWKVGNYLPSDTASRPIRFLSSSIPLWEHRILQHEKCCNSFVDISTNQTKENARVCGRLSVITSSVEASSCLSFSSACSCCTYVFEPGPVPDLWCGSTISERVVTVGVTVSILRKGIDSLQSRTVRQVPFMAPKDHSATRNAITKLAAAAALSKTNYYTRPNWMSRWSG